MSTGDLSLPDLDAAAFAGAPPERDLPAARSPSDLAPVLDVTVKLSAILGHARMPVGQLLKIGPGTLLELDRRVGEAVDIRINDRLVARGEVVLVDDRLGVTMTEIVRPAT